MRLAWTLLALVSLAAHPAWADKKLDQAVAKAEAQLAKGKDAEAVKILQKAVAQAPRDAEAAARADDALDAPGPARRGHRGPAPPRASGRGALRPPCAARILTLQSALALRAGLGERRARLRGGGRRRFGRRGAASPPSPARRRGWASRRLA